jgi:universal stress protein A
MQVIKNILVPTDFSAASKSALRYACKVADAFGAAVHVMHVFENPFGRETFLETCPPPPREYVEALDRQARADLDAQLTMEEQAKYSAVLTMRMGVPAPEILRYIQEHGAIDLVVMATAGRGGVARLLMGSVADKIVRAAPCPVLTLHRGEQDDANVTEEAA